jgi:hypothetical protein
MTQQTWRQLGKVSPTSLVDERLQLHWAAQIVSSLGGTFNTPAPDDSHPSLECLAALEVLAGLPIEGTDGLRGALHPTSFSLQLLGRDGTVVARCSLDGKTLADGYEWLEGALAEATDGGLTGKLKRNQYELPDHPVAHGRGFDGSGTAAFEELSAWYFNSDLVLRELQSTTPNVTDVQCWPHHFDIAVLVFLEEDQGDPEKRRSVGIGLSPGDGSYAEPYWYANPWPRPGTDALPPLQGAGRWHTEGWLGAVLTGTDLVAAGDAGAQRKRIQEFLDSALQANRALLGA